MTAVDVSSERVDALNQWRSPIIDKELQEYLDHKELHLTATTDAQVAYKDADFIVIATPTNYDPDKNFFDTSSIEAVLDIIKEINPDTTVIIKSTIPVGYTVKIRVRYGMERIIFSPEFLREGRALYDNLYPSRIIVGDDCEQAHIFADLLLQGAMKKIFRFSLLHLRRRKQ